MTISTRTDLLPLSRRPTSRFIPGLASALVSAIMLTACAGQGTQDMQTVAAQDRALFAHRYVESMPSTDWNRMEYIRNLQAEGQSLKAIELLKPMARTHPEALYELARIYDDGAGVPRDPELAVHYYRQAVPYEFSGLDNASLKLGRLYLAGDGVKRDPALAWNLFQQAIDHDGNPSARIEVAEMQLAGEGVPRD
ncbi:MAG: tetratricopeptide repeat protein, partial [Pseudomonadota bacterium]|nr:tetratricopeptide repeat protein [Pseudomonadota bacterium]